VLISRHWSGKTLADHRADNQTWLRAVLSGAYADHEHDDQDQDVTVDTDRYTYQLADPTTPTCRLYRSASCGPSPTGNAAEPPSPEHDPGRHECPSVFRQPHHPSPSNSPPDQKRTRR